MTTTIRAQLTQLADAGRRARARLRTTITIAGREYRLYNAGMRGKSVRFGPFGRDLLIAAWMSGEPEFMREAIQFVGATMGEKIDPTTGEEPGRGLHEYNTVAIRGLVTRYNAVDVSLLLLIVADHYRRLTGDAALIDAERRSLRMAAEYLMRHIDDALFIEDPRNCNAGRYALRATYWKDSHLPGRGDPIYPVTYTLVQAQAIAALRATARLGDALRPVAPEDRLNRLTDTMVARLWTDLWDNRTSYPVIARDTAGAITGISSDGLHMLSYLEPGDVPPDRLAHIAAGAHHLATPVGYRTYAPHQPDYSPTAYHLGAIWPLDQYFIARGAVRHGLLPVMTTALQVVPILDRLGFVELYYWDDEKLSGPRVAGPAGCDLQLWSTTVPAGLLSLPLPQ